MDRVGTGRWWRVLLDRDAQCASRPKIKPPSQGGIERAAESGHNRRLGQRRSSRLCCGKNPPVALAHHGGSGFAPGPSAGKGKCKAVGKQARGGVAAMPPAAGVAFLGRGSGRTALARRADVVVAIEPKQSLGGRHHRRRQGLGAKHRHRQHLRQRLLECQNTPAA